MADVFTFGGRLPWEFALGAWIWIVAGCLAFFAGCARVYDWLESH